MTGPATKKLREIIAARQQQLKLAPFGIGEAVAALDQFAAEVAAEVDALRERIERLERARR